MLNNSPWRPTTSVWHCWQLIEAGSPLLSPHTERNSVLWSLLTRYQGIKTTPTNRAHLLAPSDHISSKDHHTGGVGLQHVDFEGSQVRLPQTPELFPLEKLWAKHYV